MEVISSPGGKEGTLATCLPSLETRLATAEFKVLKMGAGVPTLGCFRLRPSPTSSSPGAEACYLRSLSVSV